MNNLKEAKRRKLTQDCANQPSHPDTSPQTLWWSRTPCPHPNHRRNPYTSDLRCRPQLRTTGAEYRKAPILEWLSLIKPWAGSADLASFTLLRRGLHVLGIVCPEHFIIGSWYRMHYVDCEATLGARFPSLGGTLPPQ